MFKGYRIENTEIYKNEFSNTINESRLENMVSDHNILKTWHLFAFESQRLIVYRCSYSKKKKKKFKYTHQKEFNRINIKNFRITVNIKLELKVLFTGKAHHLKRQKRAMRLITLSIHELYTLWWETINYWDVYFEKNSSNYSNISWR